MLDSKRNPYNPANDFVRANATTAETSSYDIDLLSNGVKIRTTDGDYNSSATYIYMAWAEMPFKYANPR